MAKTQNESITKNKHEYAEPKMYNVVFLNDDVTTVEFVVEVLLTHFNKSEREASAIVDLINNEDRAIVGTYYHDVADAKANLVMQKAKASNYPFQVTIEEVK